MKSRRLIQSFALLFASALTACSLIPAPDTGLASPRAAFAPATLQQSAAQDLPDASWWQGFADPPLNLLVDTALARNLELQQAVERIEQARALAQAGRSALAPTGSLVTDSLTRQLAGAEMPGIPAAALRNELAGARVELGWEVDVFGRLRNIADAGGLRLQAAEADAAALRLSLQAETADAWFALENAREQLRLAENMRANWQRTLDLMQRRVAAGYAATSEAARIETELEATAARLPGLRYAIAKETHRLALLTGTAAGEFSAPASVSSPAQPARIDLPDLEQWLAQRPDVLAAEAEMHAAELDVAAVRAELLPRLSLGGVLGYAAGSLSGLGSGGTASWLLRPAISLPLLNRAQTRARLDYASARQRQAAAAWQQSVLVATQELEDALAAVNSTQTAVAANARRHTAATSAYDLVRLRFEAGAADLMELLDVQRAQQAATTALAAAHTEQRRAVVALHRALGTGLAQHN